MLQHRPSRLFAIVIGASLRPGGLEEPTAETAARSMRSLLLRQAGGAALLSASGGCLQSLFGQGATIVSVLRSLKRISERMPRPSREDLLVISFSGHGGRTEDGEEGWSMYDGVLSARLLARALSLFGDCRIDVVSDCCFGEYVGRYLTHQSSRCHVPGEAAVDREDGDGPGQERAVAAQFGAPQFAAAFWDGLSVALSGDVPNQPPDLDVFFIAATANGANSGILGRLGELLDVFAFMKGNYRSMAEYVSNGAILEVQSRVLLTTPRARLRLDEGVFELIHRP